MSRGKPPKISKAVGAGIALMATPLLLPHLSRTLSAALFDGGSIVVLICLVLIFVEAAA